MVGTAYLLRTGALEVDWLAPICVRDDSPRTVGDELKADTRWYRLPEVLDVAPAGWLVPEAAALTCDGGEVSVRLRPSRTASAMAPASESREVDLFAASDMPQVGRRTIRTAASSRDSASARTATLYAHASNCARIRDFAVAIYDIYTSIYRLVRLTQGGR